MIENQVGYRDVAMNLYHHIALNPVGAQREVDQKFYLHHIGSLVVPSLSLTDFVTQNQVVYPLVVYPMMAECPLVEVLD